MGKKEENLKKYLLCMRIHVEHYTTKQPDCCSMIILLKFRAKTLKYSMSESASDATATGKCLEFPFISRKACRQTQTHRYTDTYKTDMHA